MIDSFLPIFPAHFLTKLASYLRIECLRVVCEMLLELCFFLGIVCLILWVVSSVLKKRMVPKLKQIHAKGRFIGYGEKFVTEVRKLSKGSTTIVRNRNWQPDKPLLLFLHGFPDDIHSFDHQMK